MPRGTFAAFLSDSRQLEERVIHARTWIVSRRFFVFARSLVALAVAALVVPLESQAFAQTAMPVLAETFDGQARDIAAQPHANAGLGSGANSKRAWVVQGRNRSGFRLTTGERMLAEDRRFPDSATATPELARAVEVDTRTSAFGR
jgi:hypothetical protein